ncbi:hypothetical protein LBMAG21_04940 [Armatimonadota bacterium]|nr:hypothetical protein LBMAG21_04940 [Armatimonadota bacterium]
MNILRFLQTVDRRVIYVLLMLSVTAPFFLSIRLPMRVSPATEAFYSAIEERKPGDFVLLAVDWEAGTRGENGPQTEAVITHLMRKKCRFAILSFAPQSPKLTQDIVERLGKEYHSVEGVDWINWGYKVDAKNYLKGFVRDIVGVVKTNNKTEPLTKFPVMEGIKTASDIKLLVNITPSSVYQTYLQFVAGPLKVPMVVAPTSVMVPEVFNYLDSKQISGMMPGLPGAGEYEGKLGTNTKVTRFANSASFAHILIIFFIIMGNVAMLLERRQNARLGGRA